jgi:hypothetical protein
MRRITDMISEGFIWGVGITRPRPGHERTAAYFISGILGLTILVVVAMFLFLNSHMH